MLIVIFFLALTMGLSGKTEGQEAGVAVEGLTRSTSIWYNAVTTDNGGFQVIFEEGANNGQSIYLYNDKIYGVTSRIERCPAWGEAATTANEWHHVVLVWVDDGESYLYHDGTRVDTFTGKDHQQT